MSCDEDARLDAVESEGGQWLQGLTIVVSGIFETIGRDKLQSLIT